MDLIVVLTERGFKHIPAECVFNCGFCFEEPGVKIPVEAAKESEGNNSEVLVRLGG